MFHRFSLFSWNFFEFLYLCAQNESAIKEFCGTFLQKSSAVPNTPRSSKRSVELLARNPPPHTKPSPHQGLTYSEAMNTYCFSLLNASSTLERGSARFIRKWHFPWKGLPSCTATPTSHAAFSTSSREIPLFSQKRVQSTNSI